jgi:hypothetical protein
LELKILIFDTASILHSIKVLKLKTSALLVGSGLDRPFFLLIRKVGGLFRFLTGMQRVDVGILQP